MYVYNDKDCTKVYTFCGISHSLLQSAIPI